MFRALVRIIIGGIRSVADLLGIIIFTFCNIWCKRQITSPTKNPLLLLHSAKLIDLLRRRNITCVQLLEAYLNRMHESNAMTNAMVVDLSAEAMEAAIAADLTIEEFWNRGELDRLWEEKPLFGIPISIKECIALQGTPQCAGLVQRKEYRSDYDADVVMSLKRHGGAIPFCKTNSSELGMWWESYNNVYGRTCNPYDKRRIVGGSSGGEAAGIAAAASLIGLGSDVGGSVRIPAHFNGISAHKATTGTVSTHGHYPLADGKTKDYLLPGPLCRYAQDLRVVMSVIFTKDAKNKIDVTKVVPLHNVNIYYMEDIGDKLYTSPVEEDIVHRMRQVINELRKSGHTVNHHRIKLLREAGLIWVAMMVNSGATKFTSILQGSVDNSRSNLNYTVKLILNWLFGNSAHTLPAVLLAAFESLIGSNNASNEKLCQHGEELKAIFQCLLDPINNDLKEAVFLLPTHPTTAPYHSQPLLRPGNFAYTSIFNVLGLPVTTVPIGFDRHGLPFTLQVVGGMYKDHVTLSVAEAFDKLFGGWQDPASISAKINAD